MLPLDKSAALERIIHKMTTTMPTVPYVFSATLRRVVDGDTLDLTIDGGFHTWHVERVRLLGVNTPEVVGATKAAGLDAKDFAVHWLAGVELVVQSYKSDAFGRYLANVWRTSDGAQLNDDLLSSGHAVAFP